MTGQLSVTKQNLLFVTMYNCYDDNIMPCMKVRSLRVENEQMSSVIGEKSREISSLKKQIHSLMQANTSQHNRDHDQDDMSKQTIRYWCSAPLV